MEKLALVHLEKWAGKFAHELSGGMQQRVGLARAFATDADILLMDEPFSALDPLIRDKLQDDLLELQQRLHKTIVFVSHDLDEALKIGNTIAIMEGGRIVQAGAPEAIVTAPATDYVRSFVANVNPLNVLKLGSLMRPTAALQRRRRRGSQLDPRIHLDGHARPRPARWPRSTAPACRCGQCARSSRSSTARCPATGCWPPARDADARRRSRPCATAAGRCWSSTSPAGCVGLVGIDELLEALRREPNLNNSNGLHLLLSYPMRYRSAKPHEWPRVRRRTVAHEKNLLKFVRLAT